MPLLYQGDIPSSIRSDLGIMRAFYRKNFLGKKYSPAGTHMISGPYAGYSRRAVGTLENARRRVVRPVAGTAPIGPGPQASSEVVTTGMSTPSRYKPKRLWDYQLASPAPINTTLGRMRSTYSGIGPSMPGS